MTGSSTTYWGSFGFSVSFFGEWFDSSMIYKWGDIWSFV